MIQLNTAIILAGGTSNRMGFDKKCIKINSQIIIEHQVRELKKVFNEIILVINDTTGCENLNCILVEDVWKNFGPVGGIHAGLVHASSEYAYIIACDMPYIHLGYITYMKELIESLPEEKDGVITRFGEWVEPFNGFYHKKLIKTLEESMKQNQKSIHKILSKAEIVRIDEEIARKFSPDWEMFINLNTQEDVKRYKKEFGLFQGVEKTLS